MINNKDDVGPAHAVRGREVDCAVVELPGRDLVLACHVGDEDNALVGEPPSLVSCPAGVSWLSYAVLDCSLQSTLLDPALFTPLAAVRMRDERERRSFAGQLGVIVARPQPVTDRFTTLFRCFSLRCGLA